MIEEKAFCSFFLIYLFIDHGTFGFSHHTRKSILEYTHRETLLEFQTQVPCQVNIESLDNLRIKHFSGKQ